MTYSMSRLQRRLESAVSGEVDSSQAFREYYSVDASSYRIRPGIIVIPRDTDDVVAVITVAAEFGTPVTARGGGTGLVGGALNRGIILDMKRFDHVELSGYDIAAMSGTTRGKLDDKLKPSGLLFAPNPSVGPFCTVGGMLANNSAGSKSLKYGSMIDCVQSVTFIDGTGRIVSLPDDHDVGEKILDIACGIERERFPTVSKNSSGYRLDAVVDMDSTHKTLIGSEGTLGVFISAGMKAVDRPKDRILYVLEYGSVTDVASDCLDIIRTGPAAVEFVDSTILGHMEEGFDAKTDCLLFVEYDGLDSSGRHSCNTSASRILDSAGAGRCKNGAVGDSLGSEPERIISRAAHSATSLRRITGENEITRWWGHRDASLHYSLTATNEDTEERVPHIIEDASIPVIRLPALFDVLAKINYKYKTRTITYGHVGNGNIHVRLICKKDRMKDLPEIAAEYLETVIGMGGSITGEHGDGLARTKYVKNQYGARNIRQFEKIKRFFDPAGILNPGKILE